MVISINNQPPAWATRYKIVVKENKGDYHTIYTNVSYIDGIYDTDDNNSDIGNVHDNNSDNDNNSGNNIENNTENKWSYLLSTQYNSSTNPSGYTLIGGYTSATENRVIIGGSIYEANPATSIEFWTHTAVTHATGGSLKMTITSAGTVQPAGNGTQDLGTSSLRWSTVFTSDLSLSNGIGDYTIVEGENDLFLYNNKQNKVYKFVLAEVDAADATPKKS